MFVCRGNYIQVKIEYKNKKEKKVELLLANYFDHEFDLYCGFVAIDLNKKLSQQINREKSNNKVDGVPQPHRTHGSFCG